MILPRQAKLQPARKVGKGKYAMLKSKYNVCSIYLFCLLIKAHLPMVVPPVDWDIKPGVRLKRGEVPSFVRVQRWL